MSCSGSKRAMEEQAKEFLIPKDPRDEKSLLFEIRAGTGGDEAALFAGELFRLYSKYAEQKGFKVDTVEATETGIGGYKNITALIEGKGAYSHFKYEAGVHRVQRVPVTEAAGRIHTSTVTVAVMPEVDEIDVQDRSGRSSNRYLLLIRRRRAERQYDQIRGADYPYPDRSCGELPGRTVATEESHESHADLACENC